MASDPEEFAGPAQIEFHIQRGGEPMELGDLVDQSLRIEQFRGLAEATVAFGLWLQDLPSLTARGHWLAHRHLQDLRFGNDQGALVALHMMAAQVASVSEGDGWYDPRLRFDFAGAYRINPTGFRFQVHGAPYALILLAGICGCAAAYKERNADECLRRIRATELEQIAGLERMHRREGRWTTNLAESHARVIESSRLAARECHVLFPDVDINVSLVPRPHFEVRIKQHQTDATDHPKPGR